MFGQILQCALIGQIHKRGGGACARPAPKNNQLEKKIVHEFHKEKFIRIKDIRKMIAAQKIKPGV